MFVWETAITPGMVLPEKTTTRIKDIIESYSYPQKELTVDEYINQGKDKFFNFTFPWYATDNTGLEDFKQLFLHRYYMKQIGQETPALFKLNMQAILMDEMSRWEQLYQSTLFTYDPLTNRKLTRSDSYNDNSTTTVKDDRTLTENTSNTDTSTTSNNQETQSINSDNPQVTISTKDYASEMNRGKTTNTGNNNVSSKGTLDNTQSATNNNTFKGDHTGSLTEEGFIGTSYTDNILKYRQAILNINSEICDRMRPLFFMVY